MIPTKDYQISYELHVVNFGDVLFPADLEHSILTHDLLELSVLKFRPLSLAVSRPTPRVGSGPVEHLLVLRWP
jgi:hypothetical protein